MHASRKSTCSLVAVQDIVFQLQRLVNAMSRYHEDCFAVLQDTNDLFPIEVDLSRGTFTYDTSGQINDDDDDDDDEDAADETGEDANNLAAAFQQQASLASSTSGAAGRGGGESENLINMN